MRIYTFTICGNQDDQSGNPLPKHRLTRNQQWTPKAQRYVAWKYFVQKAFLESLSQIDYRVCVRSVSKHKKPITLATNERAVMDIRIAWKNGRRGDPENVFGSIADALFHNDKNLDGSFESSNSEDKKGRVDVKIIIKDI